MSQDKIKENKWPHRLAWFRTRPFHGRDTGSNPVRATVMHPYRQEATQLRLAGKSYGEIAKTLSVSKGSLSLWFKNLELTPAAKKLLKDKMKSAYQHGLFENNQRRTEAIKIENQKIRESSASEINPLSKYELLLIGAALYWAEGYNRQDKVPSPCISFGNSNPDMVILFLRFLREVMQIPEEKLRPFVQIHNNIDSQSVIQFWSDVCNIPKERFRTTRQTSRASKGKRPHNSLPYGTLKLNVNGRQNFFKIKGWIDGLIKRTS